MVGGGESLVVHKEPILSTHMNFKCGNVFTSLLLSCVKQLILDLAVWGTPKIGPWPTFAWSPGNPSTQGKPWLTQQVGSSRQPSRNSKQDLGGILHVNFPESRGKEFPVTREQQEGALSIVTSGWTIGRLQHKHNKYVQANTTVDMIFQKNMVVMIPL